MEDLISILSEYPFVTDYQVLHFETTRTTRRLKVSVDIVDGSRLVISEASNPCGFRYAYHWQDSPNRLLARWDNAPHHPDLPTFPHHFHDGRQIQPSVQPTIRELFEYIAQHFKK